MKSVYDNAGVILSFMIGVIFLQMFTGTKFTRSVLLLILFSQFILNPSIVESFQFKNLNKTGEDEEPKTTTPPSYRHDYIPPVYT